jgi:hypothetical protein
VQEVGKESPEREQDIYYIGNRPWLQASPSSDWKTQTWIIKPKGSSKQAEKVSVRGGGRHAGGCRS